MKTDLTYLSAILERINKIETFTMKGKDAFFRDEMVQDAVIRNFEVIGEAVKSLSQAYKDTYPEITWKNWAAFRDILIHRYETVDIAMVWNTIEFKLPDLKEVITKSTKPD